MVNIWLLCCNSAKGYGRGSVTEEKNKLDILTPEGMRIIRNLIVSAQGGDPEAQQTLNDFMRFDDSIERTNLPTRKDVQRIAYLSYIGRSLFPDNFDDPFTIAAECISKSFMAKGGEKSKQFVQLFQKTPNVIDLTSSTQEESIRGRFGKLLGRESNDR